MYSMQEFTNDLHSDDHRDDIDDNNLLNLIGTVRMMGVVELDISSPIPISNIPWSQLRSRCEPYLLPYFHRQLKLKSSIPLDFSWIDGT